MKKAHEYENVQIGNFLISIGYHLRELERPLTASVNLLQQTPMDQTFGDIFGALAGKYFILEFKPNRAYGKNERIKKQRIKLIAKLLSNEDLKLVSNKCHFIGFPSLDSQNQLKYNFERYFNFFIDNKHEVIIADIKEFVENLINETSDFGGSVEDIKKYIETLKDCSGSSETREGSFSGILVNVNKDLRLSSFTFDDIQTLSQSMNLSQDLNLNKQISQAFSRNNGRSKDRGMSL